MLTVVGKFRDPGALEVLQFNQTAHPDDRRDMVTHPCKVSVRRGSTNHLDIYTRTQMSNKKKIAEKLLQFCISGYL